MQKIKQVFSGHEERETSSSPRNSISGNSTYDNTNSANQSSASKNWALGAVGQHTGDEATGAPHASGHTGLTGSALPEGASDRNVHSGSTGVGSNIGRDSSNISGGQGLGNAATGSGTTRGLETRAGDSAYSDRDTSLTSGSGHRHGNLQSSPTTGGTSGTLPPGRGPGTNGLGGSESTGREGLTGDRYDSSTTGSRGVSGSGLTGDSTTRHSHGDSTTRHSHSGVAGAAAAATEKLGHNHTIGHDSRDTTKFDPRGPNTEHDHQHLQAVTHDAHRHIEVEEVERQRDQHRHVHHLQHHVQPIQHTEVRDEVHHEKLVPETKIQERHVNTEDDVKLFHSLGEKHRDEERHLAKERTVVDLGEKVNTTTHHHVHHVTQPVVEREVQNKHRIHTVIPISHTVHEAPIVHKSSVHEPVRLEEFLKGGGKLDSGITHREAGVLSTGDCDRQVEGEGEKLISQLNLNPSSYGNSSTGTTTGSTTGTTTNTGRI